MAHETPPQTSSAADLPDPEDEPETLQDVAGAAPDAPQDTADAVPDAPAPVLNRAERRAQAKGKAAPSGGGSSAGGGARTPGPRGGGHVVPVRFPRTGNK